MATFGIELAPDDLVLTRGRDFKWTLENVDPVTKESIPYPAGDLFFELSTHGEHNARQHFDIVGANGGTYTLTLDSDTTAPMAFDAAQLVIQQHIAALPGIGEGNVTVTGSYTPQWIFTVDWTDSMPLTAGVVDLFNTTVTAAFNALDFITGGLGVWLEGHYETSSFVFRLTYKGSLLEQEIVNFVGGVIADVIGAINSALAGVEQFTGEIADISLIYAPLRHFDIEFVNGKGLTPIDKLSATSSLTGHSPTITVAQDARGRAPFTIWPFEIDGSTATIKIESEDADSIPSRTRWQLVFMPEGEPAGGDPVARGTVREQAPR